jgi:hypothetical protein
MAQVVQPEVRDIDGSEGRYPDMPAPALATEVAALGIRKYERAVLWAAHERGQRSASCSMDCWRYGKGTLTAWSLDDGTDLGKIT